MRMVQLEGRVQVHVAERKPKYGCKGRVPCIAAIALIPLGLSISGAAQMRALWSIFAFRMLFSSLRTCEGINVFPVFSRAQIGHN